MQCKDCRFNVHKKCMEKVPMDCPGEAPKEWSESLEKENPDEESDVESENSSDPKSGNFDEEADQETRAPQPVTYVRFRVKHLLISWRASTCCEWKVPLPLQLCMH